MASPNIAQGENPPDPLHAIGKKLGSVSSHLGQVAGQVNAQGTKLGQLTAVLSSQAVAGVVPVFDGKPSEFRGWIKAIEKYVTLAGLGEQDTRSIAYQRSVGVVSDFIGRYVQGQEDVTWAGLKGQLKARFGEITDSHQAFALLQKCKQKKDETAALFAERLYGLAEEAFPEEMEIEAVQRQLVGFFVDGLSDTRVQMKVLRGLPTTFEEAATLANKEATFQKQFTLRFGGRSGVRNVPWPEQQRDHRNVEPMEVDHARSKACYVCGKTGHMARACRMKRVSAVSTRDVCFYCREQGHFKRDCPKRKQKQSN